MACRNSWPCICLFRYSISVPDFQSYSSSTVQAKLEASLRHDPILLYFWITNKQAINAGCLTQLLTLFFFLIFHWLLQIFKATAPLQAKLEACLRHGSESYIFFDNNQTGDQCGVLNPTPNPCYVFSRWLLPTHDISFPVGCSRFLRLRLLYKRNLKHLHAIVPNLSKNRRTMWEGRSNPNLNMFDSWYLVCFQIFKATAHLQAKLEASSLHSSDQVLVFW